MRKKFRLFHSFSWGKMIQTLELFKAKITQIENQSFEGFDKIHLHIYVDSSRNQSVFKSSDENFTQTEIVGTIHTRDCSESLKFN